MHFLRYKEESSSLDQQLDNLAQEKDSRRFLMYKYSGYAWPFTKRKDLEKRKWGTHAPFDFPPHLYIINKISLSGIYICTLLLYTDPGKEIDTTQVQKNSAAEGWSGAAGERVEGEAGSAEAAEG